MRNLFFFFYQIPFIPRLLLFLGHKNKKLIIQDLYNVKSSAMAVRDNLVLVGNPCGIIGQNGIKAPNKIGS